MRNCPITIVEDQAGPTFLIRGQTAPDARKRLAIPDCPFLAVCTNRPQPLSDDAHDRLNPHALSRHWRMCARADCIRGFDPNQGSGFFRFVAVTFQATSYAVRNGAVAPLTCALKSGACTRWTKGSSTVKLLVVGRITGRLATLNRPRPFLAVSPNRPLVPAERLTIHKRVDKSAGRVVGGNADAVPPSFAM